MRGPLNAMNANRGANAEMNTMATNHVDNGRAEGEPPKASWRAPEISLAVASPVPMTEAHVVCIGEAPVCISYIALGTGRLRASHHRATYGAGVERDTAQSK